MFNTEFDIGSQYAGIKDLKSEINKQKKIIYVNEFNDASTKSFYEQFCIAHDSSQDVIPIIIDSYGGKVDSLIAMIDLLKSSEKPVATVCMGKAMSCGSALLSCGTRGYRYIGPMARVMIHRMTTVSFGNLDDIKSKVAASEKLENSIFASMDENCKQAKGYFLEKLIDNTDWYLSAKDCLQHNIVDHIKIPKFRTNIKIITKFE